jgi:hypothetical protein
MEPWTGRDAIDGDASRPLGERANQWQCVVQKQRRRKPRHLPPGNPSVLQTLAQLDRRRQGPRNLWLCDWHVRASATATGPTSAARSSISDRSSSVGCRRPPADESTAQKTCKTASRPHQRTCGQQQQHDEEDGREELARELHFFLARISAATGDAATECGNTSLNQHRPVPFFPVACALFIGKS